MTISNPKISQHFFILFLLFSWTTLGAFSNPEKGEMRKTVIVGNITNPLSDEVSLKFFKDNITFEEVRLDLGLNAGNRFATELQIAKPQTGKVLYRNTELPFLLFPGDSLVIKFDALNPAQNIQFSGKGAVQNKWLFESSLKFREYNEDVINTVMIEAKPLDFLAYLNRVQVRKREFLNKWLTENEMSPDVTKYMMDDLEYWFLFELFRYPSFHQAVNGLEQIPEIPSSFFDPLKKIAINQSAMLRNENYLNFVNQLFQFWNDAPEYQPLLLENSKGLLITSPSALVLSNPDGGAPLGSFNKGISFLPTGKKSKESSDLLLGDSLVSGYWLEVDIGFDKKGWVHESAVMPIAQGLSADLGFLKLLAGEPLAYFIANVTHWGQVSMTSDLENLMKENSLTIDYSYLSNSEIAAPSFIFRIIEAEAVDSALAAAEAAAKPKYQQNGIRRPSHLNAIDLPDVDITLKEITTQDFILDGRIVGLGSREVAIGRIINPLSQRDEKIVIRLKNDGSFNVKIPLKELTFGILSIGRDQVKIMMRPGKRLSVNLSGTDLSQMRLTGADAKVANFFFDMDTHLKSDVSIYNRIIKEVDGAGFDDYIKKYKRHFENLLSNLNGVDPKIKGLLKSEIDYWYGNQLFNFPWEQPLRLGKDAPLIMPEEFYNFTQQIPLVNDESLTNPRYINYLSQILAYLAEQSGATKWEVAKDEFTGKTLWWAKGASLVSPMLRGDVASVVYDIKSYIEGCPYDNYTNEIKVLYDANRGLQLGDRAPEFALKNTRGESISLEQLKGKVIYLDFWATWCTPCLTQMRNSKQWKKQFTGKDVEFVYISLDRNSSDWSRFLSTRSIDGIHLHAGDNKVFLSEIARQYKVKKLPAIFIINKEGEIEYFSGDPSVLNASVEIIQGLL